MLKQRMHPPLVIALSCFALWTVNLVGPNSVTLYWIALITCIGALIWDLIRQVPDLRRRFVCVECQSRWTVAHCRMCPAPVCRRCAPTGYCVVCTYQAFWTEMAGGRRYHDTGKKLETLVGKEQKEQAQSKERQGT